MTNKEYDIGLLSDYFSGLLTQEERSAVEEWGNASEENQAIFKETEKVYRSINLLKEMRQYDPSAAMQKVNTRIKLEKPNRNFIYYWQRVAAILLLPILIFGGIYFYQKNVPEKNTIVWQTFSTPPGVKSQIQLPDGTGVWLNSGSKLTYPSAFIEGERHVKLLGEAFFEVAKDKKHPFKVNLGKIGVEVVGTKFNIANYQEENRTEVVLTEGKVKLFKNDIDNNPVITEMKPGQRAIYERANNKLSLHHVDTDKYTSWIEGRLVFRDDTMDEVIRKLDRWFNVKIKIANPEIKTYVYTGTFRHETITQILDLLKKTSPIEYTIIPSEKLDDGSYERQRITLTKN